jgi:hypothetical protein
MAKSVVSFALDERQDRDLLRWLDSVPKGRRSEAIREALRAQLGHSGITLGDVYQAVKELERKLSVGIVLASDTGPEEDEPAEAAANLSNLGL